MSPTDISCTNPLQGNSRQTALDPTTPVTIEARGESLTNQATWSSKDGNCQVSLLLQESDGETDHTLLSGNRGAFGILSGGICCSWSATFFFKCCKNEKCCQVS